MNSRRCNSGAGGGAEADEHVVECAKAGGGAQYYLAAPFAITCAVQSVISVRLRFLNVFLCRSLQFSRGHKQS